MSRLIMGTGLAFFVLLGDVGAQEDALKKPPAEKQIAELILKLGDSQFKVRQEAHKALVEIGKPALPQLRKAADGADPEIAARAQRIIREIEAPLIGWQVLPPKDDTIARAELRGSLSPLHCEAIEQYIRKVQKEAAVADIRSAERQFLEAKVKLAFLREAFRDSLDVSASALIVSPDGKVLAAVSDGGVRLWDVGGKELRRLIAEPRLLWHEPIAFADDGKTLTAKADHANFVWDVASGKLLSVTPRPAPTSAELEHRLDRLRRELDELRREIQNLPK